MKFIKGALIGGVIATGVAVVILETDMINKKKIMKKGRKFIKQMGII